VPRGWSPPAEEEAVGLGFYATCAPGTGGRLKTDPEDFRVREISRYPRPDPDGAFTVLRVEATNWEQHELARRLGELWRLRPGALSWAGTKDRRAVTEQLLSFRGRPDGEPPESPLPGIRVLESYRASEGVVLGHHYGNAFRIVVRDCPFGPGEADARREAVIGELRGLGRLPNFFGGQRFGEVRPVTHVVGRHLVRADPAGAVEAYLTASVGAESPEGQLARSRYAEHHDAARALREFPPAYRFERSILEHLARGQDPARALRALSRELRTLFVHAYQSVLFNRCLSLRHARGVSLDQPLAGDMLLRVSPDGTVAGASPIPVREDNLPEARELVARARAVLAGPLVGSDTPASEGTPGEILEEVLAPEAVSRSDFDLPKTPEIASRGTWRPLTIAVPPIHRELSVASSPEGPSAYAVEFALPKGCYATVLLRELTKRGAAAVESA
jgi:tRNA pseudouridine13 synthase